MCKVKELFNEIKLDSLWEKKGERAKFIFRMQLEKYTKEWIEKYPIDEIYKVTQCDIGYNGIGMGFITSGIVSEYSKNNPTLPVTKEHYMGAKKIGEIVIDALIECNFDYDYMVNTWLYENIWLWATIRVTKEEDKKLGRNKHTLDEKLKGVHYDEAGIKLTIK